MSQRRRTAEAIMAIGALLLAGPVGAATLAVTVGSAQGAVGSVVEIPVTVRGAEDLGALQMDLSFDPAVLEAREIEAGELLTGLVDSNLVVPGRLRLAMATSQAVNGDGELLVLSFQVVGS